MNDMHTTRLSNLAGAGGSMWFSCARNSPEAACDAHRFQCGAFLGQAVRRATVFVLACLPLHTLAKSKAGENKSQPAKIVAGEKLVGDMNCPRCHGGSFRGAGMMPRLAGQNVMYLVGQMEAFRDGRRNLPAAMAVPKDRTAIENVASYLASLP